MNPAAMPPGRPSLEFVLLEHGLAIAAHSPLICRGQVCSMHNRTGHHMRGWRQLYRWDRRIVERICPHGVGHPDPDDYRIRNGEDSGVHGCDGCCSPACPHCTASGAGPGKTLCALCTKCNGTGKAEES